MRHRSPSSLPRHAVAGTHKSCRCRRRSGELLAAFACSMIPCSESGTSKTKHAANCPFGLPAFTRHGVFGINSRASITSLMAAKNLSRFSPVSATETCPTTRRTISVHSSRGRPFKSFNEYRLLTTFLALIPSCCDFRRGEIAGEPARAFPAFLPIAGLLMNVCLSTGRPEILSFKNGCARRIATQGLILECVAFTPVGSFEATKTCPGEWLKGSAAAPVTHFVSTGAEYTPL